jgi:competence protein ComEA
MRANMRTIATIVAVACVLFVTGFAWAEDGGAVNINTATVDQLVQLDRIGPSYAAKIVAFREANGPFEKPADITKVQGIGMKTFEINKERITVK